MLNSSIFMRIIQSHCDMLNSSIFMRIVEKNDCLTKSNILSTFVELQSSHGWHSSKQSFRNLMFSQESVCHSVGRGPWVPCDHYPSCIGTWDLPSYPYPPGMWPGYLIPATDMWWLLLDTVTSSSSHRKQVVHILLECCLVVFVQTNWIVKY